MPTPQGNAYSKTDLSNTKQTVKAGAGEVRSICVHNTAAAKTYLQIFDALAASVTVGTTTPTRVIGVIDEGTVVLEVPWEFDTGLVIASTTTPTGNTGATTVVDIIYI